MGLPNSVEHLLVAYFVNSSSSSVSVSKVLASGVPGGSYLSSREGSNTQASQSGSSRLNIARRSSSGSLRASLRVASSCGCLDGLASGQEVRSSHKDTHRNGAGESALVRANNKGLVAVSILLDRHGLLSISGVYAHVVAADSDARTSSVRRSSPCEDGITELAFDSESRWVRTVNDSNGSQSILSSTVSSSSDSKVDSGSSNAERDLVLNSILLDVLADGPETLAVVSLDGVGYTTA